jgi:hypothetical protein
MISSFGCGKYATQYSSPVLLSVYPAIDATGMASDETIWIKFSKSMDPGDVTLSGLGKRLVWASDMTATPTTFAEITPEVTWSEENTKLTVKNIYFIDSPGTLVHVIASLEGFIDTNGQKLPEGTTLWKYSIL